MAREQRGRNGSLTSDIRHQRQRAPDANDQRSEIEGQKKDEAGETPGGKAAAA